IDNADDPTRGAGDVVQVWGVRLGHFVRYDKLCWATPFTREDVHANGRREVVSLDNAWLQSKLAPLRIERELLVGDAAEIEQGERRGVGDQESSWYGSRHVSRRLMVKAVKPQAAAR